MFLYKTLLVTFLIIHISTDTECSHAKTSHRIVGGVAANIEEFPYQVSLQEIIDGRYQYFCGGVLLSLNHVATSAECVYRYGTGRREVISIDNVRVIAGTNDSMGEFPVGQKRLVERITPHEKFSEKSVEYENDIAIIKVNQPFNATNTVKPILRRTKASPANEMCVVSGWGALDVDGPPVRTLMKVEVPIVDYTTCRRYNSFVTKKILCAGYLEGGKGPCEGDFGGPLVCSSELAGIVIYSFNCGERNYPGIYTEVHKYSSWIHKVSSAVTFGSSILNVSLFVVVLQLISRF